MASPIFFTRGNTPTITDTRWFILQRILGATIDGGGGGGAHQHGNGSPVGVVLPSAVTAIYRDDVGDTYWWATGATNADWTQFV